MTSDFGNLVSNAQSHGKYLCQVSLIPSIKYGDIASRKIGINGQQRNDNGQMEEQRTDNGWPENDWMARWHIASTTDFNGGCKLSLCIAALVKQICLQKTHEEHIIIIYQTHQS